MARKNGYFWLLPVYAKVRELNMTLYKNTQKGFPTMVKASTLTAMQADVVTMLVNIGKANNARTPEARVEILCENMALLEEIKYRLRALRDCRYLTPVGFGRIARVTVQCRRQLEGWAKASGGAPEAFPGVVIITVEEDELLGETSTEPEKGLL